MVVVDKELSIRGEDQRLSVVARFPLDLKPRGNKISIGGLGGRAGGRGQGSAHRNRVPLASVPTPPFRRDYQYISGAAVVAAAALPHPSPSVCAREVNSSIARHRRRMSLCCCSC